MSSHSILIFFLVGVTPVYKRRFLSVHFTLLDFRSGAGAACRYVPGVPVSGLDPQTDAAGCRRDGHSPVFEKNSAVAEWRENSRLARILFFCYTSSWMSKNGRYSGNVTINWACTHCIFEIDVILNFPPKTRFSHLYRITFTENRLHSG